MSDKTKAIFVIVIAALGVIGLLAVMVVMKYHINRERFPDAAPWTWWW